MTYLPSRCLSQILYLDSSEIRFPTVPGAQDLDSDSPQTGSSVDMPPRPWQTSPNSHFGTEVSGPRKPRSLCSPTLYQACSRVGSEVLPRLSLLQNVLRIHVLEAQDLIAKDRFLGGLVKGKSDPYVKLRVAGQSFRSHVVREDLNPRWNEVFEVRTE